MITPPRIPQLPTITHVQFFALKALMCHSKSATTLQAELSERGFERSEHAFNELMRRLEKLGLVRRRTTNRVEGDRAKREGRYEIAAAGERTYYAAQAFHTIPALELVS